MFSKTFCHYLAHFVPSAAVLDFYFQKLYHLACMLGILSMLFSCISVVKHFIQSFYVSVVAFNIC